ncbi:hypothetical protein ACJZ2D_002974 [Fusarium nematophilum]
MPSLNWVTCTIPLVGGAAVLLGRWPKVLEPSGIPPPSTQLIAEGRKITDAHSVQVAILQSAEAKAESRIGQGQTSLHMLPVICRPLDELLLATTGPWNAIGILHACLPGKT